MRNKRSTAGNDRALAQAQQGNIYGRFVDVGAAFNQGLMMATKAGTVPTTNPVGSVKNNYEIKLEKYLNNLPPNMDLAAIPEVYRGNIQEFLMNKKMDYVNLGNQLMDYEVGTADYLEIQNQMSGISNSMKNLKNQFDIYGANKKELTKDINEDRTSLSIENQANVNLLRGVYNEEYPISIDELGNIGFVGDDGERKLNELPGYENVAFGIATSMEKIAENAYNNGFSKGIVISDGDANFNRDKNNLINQIKKGGRNSLMSIIHDGIVGDTKMIENPIIAENLKRYNEGSLSGDGLTKLVADIYMDAVIENSVQGAAASKGREERGGTVSNKYYSMVPIKNEFGEITGYRRDPYAVGQYPSLVLTLEEYKSGMRFNDPNRAQVKSATETPSSEDVPFSAIDPELVPSTEEYEKLKTKTRNQAAKEAKEKDANVGLPKLG